MDEQALLRAQIKSLQEQIELMKQTLVVKDVEIEVCKCGTPHKLYVMRLTGDEI
jgi:hypothetical protein